MNEQREGQEAHGAPGDETVGTLAEEATRLLGAFSGWAREQHADPARGAEDLAAGLADSWHQVDEHLDTGAAECTVCPVCRTVHAVRSLDPEVRGHLASAAASLAQAAALVFKGLATGAADPGSRRRGASDGVQHIDLEDGGDAADWDLDAADWDLDDVDDVDDVDGADDAAEEE